LVETARRQEKARKAIVDSGGQTYFDWEVDGVYGLPEHSVRECPVPSWIRGLFGDDMLFNVVTVRCGSAFADDDMRLLSRFDTRVLVALQLHTLTDRGVDALPAMANLKTIKLQENHTTDDGLTCVERFPHLKYLIIEDFRISPESFLYLKTRFKGLKVLTLAS